MKVVCKLLISIALLQGAAFAQAPRPDEPSIDVVDGKISMSAQAISLGRLLTLFDRAMGTKSEVKAGLENRNISVQFANLSYNDAIRKIFQGQPLNYVVIQGKGIRVTELAQGGTSSDPGFTSAPSFSSSPSSLNSPIQPIQQSPVQPANPPATSIFGGGTPAPTPNANPSAPASAPGAIPPPIGATNPLIVPQGGAGGGVMPGPTGGGAPAPAGPPPAPGTLGGATPGTIR